jgi:hypothetical protein
MNAPSATVALLEDDRSPSIQPRFFDPEARHVTVPLQIKLCVGLLQAAKTAMKKATRIRVAFAS